MLTTLYRDAYGDEQIYEAEQVLWICQNDRREESSGYGPGVLIEFGGDKRVHIPVRNCGSTSDIASPQVFVMNSNGKTVATYYL